ncbi:MAG: hypothetical protein AB8G11_25585, partial [Saprospiraceae bacterium]
LFYPLLIRIVFVTFLSHYPLRFSNVLIDISVSLRYFKLFFPYGELLTRYNYNVFFGHEAGVATEHGSGSIALGEFTLHNGVYHDQDIAIGTGCGFNIEGSTTQNLTIGYYA